MADCLRRRYAAILCASPAVVAVYDGDFIWRDDVFAAFARANGHATFLVQLGFEHETPGKAEELAQSVERVRSAAPGARVVVLCNCEKEREEVSACGLEARFIHQNAFLDERRYRPSARRDRPFAAAYIARLAPFKRHLLIPPEAAKDVMLMGTSVKAAEKEYAATVEERYAAARWVRRFRGADVSLYLAEARCGLALSAAEGACFASGEYFLCGLPVVDTPALGGRDAVYPEEFVYRADATCESVGAGIEHWTENRPDPREVRAAWLEKVRPHREAFRELMRELTGRRFGRIPHKLGIRTPHPGGLFSLAVAARLFWKGL